MKGKSLLLLTFSLLLVLSLGGGIGGLWAKGPEAPGQAPLLAPLGCAFTYQGRLIEGDTPVTDTCDFKFSLWDAASGGGQIGSTLDRTASVNNGLFTIPDLNFACEAFNGDARWLKIEVRCPAGSGSYVPLTPRQELTATPYAIYALHAADAVELYCSTGCVDSLEIEDGTISFADIGQNGCSAQEIMKWSGSAWVCAEDSAGVHDHWGGSWSGSGTGLTLDSSDSYGLSATGSARGVSALATGGAAIGVYGQTNSTSGTGVKGWAATAGGATYGVYGGSASISGTGVYGVASYGSGTTYGVKGESVSASGYGVYGTAPYTGTVGIATDTTGTTYGVYGKSNSSSGRGVYGEAPARGVYGYATNTSGITHGVFGKADSPDAWAVYGTATHTTGSNVGVYGESASSSGTGVWAVAPANGVVARATKTSGTSYGVYAHSNSSGGYGGFFVNTGGGYLLAANDVESTSDLEFKVSNSGNVYADGRYYCGQATNCYNTGTGADIAERIDALEALEPGDVVEIDPGHVGHFRRARTPFSHAVAGVVSTNPAMTMGNDFDPEMDVWNDDRPLLALVGIVPVKASAENGPISPGDLLVASSTPGHAMRGGDDPPIGTVIGKALEGLDSGTGVIQMLVVLQ